MASTNKKYYRDLRLALMAAFPKPQRLALMVEDELDEDLIQITQEEPDYELTVQSLVMWADSQGRFRELFFAALWKNPGNPKLRTFVQQNLRFPLTIEAFLELYRLLDAIDFGAVRDEYQACLTGRNREAPATLVALIAKLAEIPGESDDEPNKPLWRFVSHLIKARSLTAEQRQFLKAWATNQGMSSQEDKPESSETAEVCLMIKVQPRAHYGAFRGYVVSAAISQDPDPWNSDVVPMTTLLTISMKPNAKCAPDYAEEDLPDILDELIGTCGEKYHIPLSDLIIQWFLPTELMSLPLEHWQIQIGKTHKQCNGRRCKAIIVRSSDRHLPHYQRVSSDWEKRWKCLLAHRQSRCAETLVLLDPKTNQTTINWRKSKVVGCRFVAHHEPQQQEDLWDQLLGEGVPIALWMRHQAGEDPQMTKKVMQSVIKCSIVKLSESLAAHRQKALSHDSEPDRLKAASLCLLLDNPFRPFPTLDYQSDYQSA